MVQFMNYKESKGLLIKCSNEIDMRTRDICCEFGRWLRRNVNFPIRLTIYIKDSYKRKNKLEKEFSASFVVPLNANDNPYIKVATCNRGTNKSVNEHKVEVSILHSIAHEVTHYIQWINNLEFSENDAVKNSRKLVRMYFKDRKFDLGISPNCLKLLRTAEKYSNLNKMIIYNPQKCHSMTK